MAHGMAMGVFMKFSEEFTDASATPVPRQCHMLRSQGDKAGSLVDYITGQMERVYPGDLHRVFAPGGAATCDDSSFVFQKILNI